MRSYFVAFLLLCVFSASAEWKLDILDGYENQILVLDKGVEATLVRKQDGLQSEKAVLYVHGYNDYFFQSQLGDSIESHGYSFYALDLRSCGRSIREGKKPYDMRNMKDYFEEINKSLAIMESNGCKDIYLMGHSTGGLVLSYYLAEQKDYGNIRGLILNSPFMDMNLSKFQEKFLVPFVSILPFKKISISQGSSRAYADSLLKGHHGEWSYDPSMKFELSQPVTSGWIGAIHKAQKRLRKKDVNIAMPILLMRSDKSVYGEEWTPEFNCGDSVLDVEDISKYGKRLGKDVEEAVFTDGLHDLILSRSDVRDKVYAKVFEWLERH